jgi:probable phosphoglycerate mutase
MTTRLLIARHGNTFGPGDTVRRVGITDLPLVDTGLIQGQRLGAYLKNNHLIPDVIFTSELKRAIQTAEQAQKIMQTHVPIKTVSIFNEIDYGPDENQPEDSVLARIGIEALAAWEKQAIVPSGWKVDPLEIIQHWNSFSDQITRDYAEKTILVVTSNGIARFAPYLTGDFTAFTAQHHIKLSTGALGLFEKKASAEPWCCLQWNIKPT